MSSTVHRSSRPTESDEQLSPVDGLAQLSFLTLGLLERRAAEHGTLDHPDATARGAARSHSDHA